LSRFLEILLSDESYRGGTFAARAEAATALVCVWSSRNRSIWSSPPILANWLIVERDGRGGRHAALRNPRSRQVCAARAALFRCCFADPERFGEVFNRRHVEIVGPPLSL
jgi:hypothetical protein